MLRRLEPLRSFTLPSDAATRSGVTVVRVYADGHKLLAGTPYLLVVLDAVTGAQERTLHRWKHGKAGSEGAVSGAGISHDGARAVVCFGTPEMVRWDQAVSAVAWSPDGRTIATGDADGAVGYWDAASGERRAGGDDGAEVAALSFAPDRSFLASGGAEVRLWPGPA